MKQETAPGRFQTPQGIAAKVGKSATGKAPMSDAQQKYRHSYQTSTFIMPDRVTSPVQIHF